MTSGLLIYNSYPLLSYSLIRIANFSVVTDPKILYADGFVKKSADPDSVSDF